MNPGKTPSNTATILTTVDQNKNESNKKQKKIIGTIVTSEFFEPKTIASTSLAVKTIMKKSNKLDAIVDRELDRDSIIYSEDVSRKKMKLNEYCRLDHASTNSNDGMDFFENLKKNIDVDGISESILNKIPRSRKNAESKKKMLFNDDSLKLMNNFKDFCKDRDNASNKATDTQVQSVAKVVPIKSHSSKRDMLINQENIDNRIYSTQKKESSIYYQIPVSSGVVLPKLNSQIFSTTNCSTPTIYNQDLIHMKSGQQTSITHECSQVSTLSFSTSLLQRADKHIDELMICPTPPQVQALSIKHNPSQKQDLFKSSHNQSYF